jgi:hypothetical protein
MEKDIYHYYHHRRRLLMKERWIMGKFCFSVKQKEEEEEINEPVSSLVVIYHNHTPCLKR